jgi:hypothetical protein
MLEADNKQTPLDVNEIKTVLKVDVTQIFYIGTEEVKTIVFEE